MKRSRHRQSNACCEAIVKKSKQRAAKSAARKQRGKRLKRAALAAGNSLSLPAWPSLAQLRDRLQRSAVVEADSYHFEQSLQ
jgi:hypothetical protein